MAAHSRPAGQDIFARFDPLFSLVPEEVVARTLATDIVLPDGRTLVLLTLDNRPGNGPASGPEQNRPTTLGPATLVGFGRALQAQRGRAAAGEIAALAVTGKPHFLAAGADLSAVANLRDPEHGRLMAELGHAAYGLLANLGVPTFAFINGVALGGGLELALACTYRTVSAAATGIGLPEAFLGLVPGWGGIHRLPRLIGPEAALKVMLEDPLTGNRSLDGPAAHRLGIADALFGSADFLESSIAWAASVLEGTAPVRRPHAVDPANPAVAARWAAAAEAARAFVEAKTSNAAPAPAKVIELFEAGRNLTPAESAQLECRTLTELMQSPQFHDTVYAFLELVQKRARHPAGAPGRHLARPVEKVGVVGAGLMAGQLALLFAAALEVPVVLTDVDQARVDQGLSRIRTRIGALEAKGRLSPEAARRTRDLISGSVHKEGFADAGLVVEAVFENLAVKRRVFAELEAVVSPGCVLATNTSSLSVADMASGLAHPERVAGLHFFNPVAAMPLVEIVRAPHTSEAVLATAFALAGRLDKTAVLVKDSPAFVVNRILLRLLGEIQNAFDNGTPAEVADGALRPLGLPMSPFTLLAMVGPPVALQVAGSLQAAFGDRFRVSANLQALVDAGVPGLWETGAGVRAIPASTLALLSFGRNPSTAEQLLERTQDALAEEIGLMLAEGVVAGPEEIDLCMILGAGWPLHLGGITPYLDRVGASERINGRRFHPRR